MASDQENFTIDIPALEESAAVLEFSGNEEVSNGILYQVNCAVNYGQVNYDEIMFTPVRIGIHLPGGDQYIHGVINSIAEAPSEGDASVFSFEITDVLALLKLSTASKVFEDMSIKDILVEKMEAMGIPAELYRLDTSRLDESQEYLVQYNETDHNFISRLLEREGVFYYWEHTEDASVLVFSDSSADCEQLGMDLVYRAEGGMVEDSNDSVYNVNRKWQAEPRLLTKKTYNYRDPESSLQSSMEAENGIGENYRYTREANDMGRLEALTENEKDVVATRRFNITAVSNCHYLRAGVQFTLDCGTSNFSGDYFCHTLTRKGSQEGALTGVGENSSYLSTFAATPASTAFRPERKTQKPRVNGVMSAKTAAQDDKYAYLDESGRYHAHFPFDLRSADDDALTLPIRSMQPYSGSGYGMHFPVHKNTEMIIAFENGDIDHPIALGTAPNPTNASPVNANNSSQNIIKTASGHQICLEDLEDSTHIAISSCHGHSIRMEGTSMTLSTSGGHRMFFDDDKKEITINTMEDKAKMVFKYDTCAIDFATKSGHTLNMSDDSGTMSITDASGANSVTIDEGGKIKLDTAGDIEMTATGNVNINASADFNVTAKNINLESSASTTATSTSGTTIEAGTDLGLKGANLTAEATVNADLKAGAAASVKGTSVETNGTATNKVAGANVAIEGQAACQIKAAMVMLN